MNNDNIALVDMPAESVLRIAPTTGPGAAPAPPRVLLAEARRRLLHGATPAHPKSAFALLRAVRFITERFDDPDLGVDAIAAEAGLSPGHCCRLFRRYLDDGALQYVRRARMAHAQTLLLTTASSIKEIAGLVGYRSTAEFDRHFKTHTGLPPTSWRLHNAQ